MTEFRGNFINANPSFLTDAPYFPENETYLLNGFTYGMYQDLLDTLQDHLNFSAKIFKRKDDQPNNCIKSFTCQPREPKQHFLFFSAYATWQRGLNQYAVRAGSKSKATKESRIMLAFLYSIGFSIHFLRKLNMWKHLMKRRNYCDDSCVNLSQYD